MGFFGGYACRAQCAQIPCHAKICGSGRSFKLSVVVHSAVLTELDGPGLIENQRPLIGISVADRTKETELGDWSKEKGQWCFREVITVVVNTNEEITIFVSSCTQYNLYVASVSLNSRRLGEISFPVAQLLTRLKGEDRDTEGIIYTTPVLDFDVVQEGRRAGRVHLSFETKTALPSQKLADPATCCAWGGGFVVGDRSHTDDETTASEQMSARSSSLSAPFRWDQASNATHSNAPTPRVFR